MSKRKRATEQWPFIVNFDNPSIYENTPNKMN